MVDWYGAGDAAPVRFLLPEMTVGSVNRPIWRPWSIARSRFPALGGVAVHTQIQPTLDRRSAIVRPLEQRCARQARYSRGGAGTKGACRRLQLNGMTDALLTALKASEFQHQPAGARPATGCAEFKSVAEIRQYRCQGYSRVVCPPLRPQPTELHLQTGKQAGDSNCPSNATVIAGTTTATVTSGTAAVTIG